MIFVRIYDLIMKFLPRNVCGGILVLKMGENF